MPDGSSPSPRGPHMVHKLTVLQFSALIHDYCVARKLIVAHERPRVRQPKEDTAADVVSEFLSENDIQFSRPELLAVAMFRSIEVLDLGIEE